MASASCDTWPDRQLFTLHSALSAPVTALRPMEVLCIQASVWPCTCLRLLVAFVRHPISWRSRLLRAELCPQKNGQRQFYVVLMFLQFWMWCLKNWFWVCDYSIPYCLPYLALPLLHRHLTERLWDMTLTCRWWDVWGHHHRQLHSGAQIQEWNRHF